MNDDKKPPLTEKQIEYRIMNNLKNTPNQWRGEYGYFGKYPSNEEKPIVKKVLDRLVKSKKIRYKKKTDRWESNEYLFYKKQFDITYDKGIFTFLHPEKGKATFDTNTGHKTISVIDKRSNKTKDKNCISLVKYFSGTSIGNVGEPTRRFMDDRKIIVEDLRQIGKWGDYICDTILPNFFKYTKHVYKNLGMILPYLSKFENMYNWKKEGIELDFITEYSPSVLPKPHRNIIKENNVEITKEMMEIIIKNPEYFKRILILLKDEFIPNEPRNNDRYYYQQNTWSKILSSSNFKALVFDEGYDSKAIIRYLFNYLLPYEQLKVDTALQLLRDYASMQRQMGVADFKRYPKFLKSNHDIIQGEYKVFNNKIDAIEFAKKIRKELEFKMMRKKDNKEIMEFIVEIPKSPEDVKFEGKALSHCVGSYIERIMKGETQILFLRKREGVPMVTLEVREKVLIQAKGYANRSITKEEQQYIKRYAKEKQLLVRI